MTRCFVLLVLEVLCHCIIVSAPRKDQGHYGEIEKYSPIGLRLTRLHRVRLSVRKKVVEVGIEPTRDFRLNWLMRPARINQHPKHHYEMDKPRYHRFRSSSTCLVIISTSQDLPLLVGCLLGCHVTPGTAEPTSLSYVITQDWGNYSPFIT